LSLPPGEGEGRIGSPVYPSFLNVPIRNPNKRRGKPLWILSLSLDSLFPHREELPFLSSRGAKRRGDLLIELPQQRKTRLPRKRNHELAMTTLGLRLLFAIPDIFPLSLDGRGLG